MFLSVTVQFLSRIVVVPPQFREEHAVAKKKTTHPLMKKNTKSEQGNAEKTKM